MKFYEEDNVKKFATSVVLIWLITALNACALSITAKEKYPYPLLTEDHDILNENDLGAFTWGFKPRLFTTEESSGQYNYWQCFPREQVKVSLEDIGYSSTELGWKNNVAYLKINVMTDKGIIHAYEMRANWSIKDSQKRFNKWLGLMKGEKYVCLAGEFVRREHVVRGIFREEYGWVFEKLKTKKGCDSYFDSCHPTYESYLREQAEEERR